MRPRSRPLVAVLIGAALLAVGVSCTSDSTLTGPSTEPPSQRVAAAPDLKLAGAPVLGSVLKPTVQGVLQTLDLLTCSTQPYARKTAVVGPAGGTVVVGSHRLVIPAGALAAPVQITAEQVSGPTNSVRFAPEGLTFAKPATLTLTYGNCLLTPRAKDVVYTDDQLNILERVPSKDAKKRQSVSGDIRHFSRYAVAY